MGRVVDGRVNGAPFAGIVLTAGSVLRADDAAGPVLSALVACPSRPDELAARLNEDVLTLLRTLTDHEARGLVERLPDGRYSPTKEYLLGQNG